MVHNVVALEVFLVHHEVLEHVPYDCQVRLLQQCRGALAAHLIEASIQELSEGPPGIELLHQCGRQQPREHNSAVDEAGEKSPHWVACRATQRDESPAVVRARGGSALAVAWLLTIKLFTSALAHKPLDEGTGRHVE